MITQENELTYGKIENLLNQCIGSERFYRHALIKSLVYTEGMQAFAEYANAYWFIDCVASYLHTISKNNMKHQDFFNIVGVKVKDNSGHFYVRHDSNTRKYIKQDIPFIDLPNGEYTFYLIYNGQGYTLLVKTEY